MRDERAAPDQCSAAVTYSSTIIDLEDGGATNNEARPVRRCMATSVVVGGCMGNILLIPTLIVRSSSCRDRMVGRGIQQSGSSWFMWQRHAMQGGSVEVLRRSADFCSFFLPEK